MRGGPSPPWRNRRLGSQSVEAEERSDSAEHLSGSLEQVLEADLAVAVGVEAGPRPVAVQHLIVPVAAEVGRRRAGREDLRDRIAARRRSVQIERSELRERLPRGDGRLVEDRDGKPVGVMLAHG
jgi:hypothetical protein